MLQFFQCSVIFHITGIESCSWFKQHDLTFFFCIRPMFNTPGDDDKLTLIDSYGFAFKFHIKASFYYIKQFIFMIMVMPDKWAFELYQLYHLSVQLAHNFGTPLFFEQRKFFSKIYFFHFVKLK